MSQRERLSDEREAITHRFVIGDQKLYVIVGLYPDGRPGELFLHLSKPGTVERGLCDTVGVLTSLCLQSGILLETLIAKFKETRFEPSGWVEINGQRTYATSIVDCVFRWMEARFLSAPSSNAEPTYQIKPIADENLLLLKEGTE
jgi:ribonucleoside-diphosphate reductase alpha chain